jgi:hypothetical protein
MAAKLDPRAPAGGLVMRMRRGAISKTRVLLPRPFLGPALDQVIANGLADRVRKAIESGLKFERAKK